MISSRCPRPIGIMPSIALSPVCTGVLTGWRRTTPGALCSAGRVSEVRTSPLSSSGRPSGSTKRPLSSSPTGISSSWPVRFTVSPSTTLSHSPNSTVPTLSCSRLSARPVTPCGSSSISRAMQLSRPWTRAIPSATESTVPTSARSAPSVSSPSIRSRRILAISSGLISIGCLSLVAVATASAVRCLGRLGHLLSQSLQLAVQARVEHHVPDSQHEAADDAVVDLALKLDRLPGLTLDLGAHPSNDLRIEVDSARQPHLQLPVLGCPQVVEAPADAEDDRHAVLLGEQLEEVDQLGLGSGDSPRDPVAFLGRAEVGAEQEYLQVAALGYGVGELPELLADGVELAVLLRDLE